MARRPPSSLNSKSLPTQPAKLSIPRQDASTLIEKQIQEGEELAVRLTSSQENEEMKEWRTYNGELLRRIFDTEEYADKFHSAPAHIYAAGIRLFGVSGPSRPYQPPPEPDHRQILQEYLSNLRLLAKTIPVIPVSQSVGTSRVNENLVNESIAQALKDKEAKEQSMALDLFISHSKKNADVALALIELLQIACHIPADRIRCTSVDGYRLPVGATTDVQLKSEVHGATAFIGLITPESIASAYVLFELGARWGANLHLASILACGADTEFLRGPLSGINALDCTSAEQIHQLVTDIAGILNRQPNSPAVYHRYVERLVEVAKQSKNTANP